MKPALVEDARVLCEAAWITLGFLILALAWDASRLDLAFAHLAGSAEGFPWKSNWLLSVALHEGARGAAWLVALGLCLSVWWPLGPLVRISQRARLQLAVSTLLGAMAVSLLKLGSHTSCPWELADFGGLAHYVSHWSLRPDGGSGHCFPAAGAASGFTFLGGYFAFRDTEPRLGRLWLLGSFVTGILLGLAQQWRGAHFMSHTLWSAALCWGVAWGVYAAWPQKTGRVEGI